MSDAMEQSDFFGLPTRQRKRKLRKIRAKRNKKNYKSFRELLIAEWFPQAYAIGVSWDEFWRMNPRILSAIAEGYNQRVRNADYLNWINGQYTLAAVTVGVERNLAGRKAKSEYPKIRSLKKSKSRTNLFPMMNCKSSVNCLLSV